MRAWEEFLLLQEKELGKPIVDKWLRSLKVLCFDACNIYLEARDFFQVSWFEEHIRHRVRDSLVNNNNKLIRVHITSLDKKMPFEKEHQTHQEKKAYFTRQYGVLDPHMTMSDFLVTEENDMAFRVMKEFTHSHENSDVALTFNPVYLFGPEGCGKTHLMQATASALREKGAAVLYVSSDVFTENLVSALRAGEMQSFRSFYRNIDALFIENIEVFSGKLATQEEFFHTFNSLHTHGKLIVISSMYSPSELKSMEERLVSRFEWGIAISMQPLVKESLKSLLFKVAEKMSVRIQENAIDFLIKEMSSNIKSLIHALELLSRRVAYKKLTQQMLYEDDIKSLLKDILEVANEVRPTSYSIVHAVAQYYGISVESILGRSQSRDIAIPRQIAMYLCRSRLALPYMKIGEFFSRDHSTVITSVRQISQGLDGGKQDIREAVNDIVKCLSTAYKTLEYFEEDVTLVGK